MATLDIRIHQQVKSVAIKLLYPLSFLMGARNVAEASQTARWKSNSRKPGMSKSENEYRMDMRVLLFLFIVGSFWCCHARDLTAVLLPYDKLTEGEAKPAEKFTRNENLCTLCEEFASEALNYLQVNKTQTEIISILHESCSRIPSFKQQCTVLVDYYAPLFFLEVSSIEAEEFCGKVALCGKDISIQKQLPKDKCELCHDAVTEALLKLKDPDTELEIIEVLLKACNKLEKAVKKCKRLVFEYAPIILVNAEEFLEKNDVCTTVLHACEASATGGADSRHAAS